MKMAANHPCTFFAVTSHRFRIVLAQRQRRAKIFRRVVHKSTGGILNRSQSLWTLWATPSFMSGGKWKYEYGRLAGSARCPPAPRAPSKDPRPGEADR